MRSSVCTPPFQWTTATTSAAGSSTSTTTSSIKVRTMRFLRRTSVRAWFHTAAKSSARLSNSPLVAGATCRRPCSSSIRLSSCWTFCNASFHRRSNSLATKRLSLWCRTVFQRGRALLLGGLQFPVQGGYDLVLLQRLLLARQHGRFCCCRLQHRHDFATD